MQKSAFISDCGQYRYELTRTWLTGGKNIAFIMLNPSTADTELYENRVVSFCQRWGFGSVMVGNLFALRATNPKDLYFHPDPIGEQNDWQLQRIIRKSEAVICAWGSHGHYKDRAHDVFHKINKPKFYLDLTIFNEPKLALDKLPKSFSLFQKPWGMTPMPGILRQAVPCVTACCAENNGGGAQQRQSSIVTLVSAKENARSLKVGNSTNE